MQPRGRVSGPVSHRSLGLKDRAVSNNGTRREGPGSAARPRRTGESAAGRGIRRRNLAGCFPNARESTVIRCARSRPGAGSFSGSDAIPDSRSFPMKPVRQRS